MPLFVPKISFYRQRQIMLYQREEGGGGDERERQREKNCDVFWSCTKMGAVGAGSHLKVVVVVVYTILERSFRKRERKAIGDGDAPFLLPPRGRCVRAPE